jgi:hypothetical protein
LSLILAGGAGGPWVVVLVMMVVHRRQTNVFSRRSTLQEGESSILVAFEQREKGRANVVCALEENALLLRAFGPHRELSWQTERWSLILAGGAGGRWLLVLVMMVVQIWLALETRMTT